MKRDFKAWRAWKDKFVWSRCQQKHDTLANIHRKTDTEREKLFFSSSHGDN